ncbi:phage tail protein [Bordetella hinzii]|nr:hypothetical protein AXA74_20325 [Bordetella hinzii LMG 13501]VEH23161.1 phage tail protein [Bordetella hinzii]
MIGASVSSQFTSTTKVVNRQLQMIGDEAAKLSQRRSKLNLLGNAEADLEKARARAAAAARTVADLRRELNAGPPRKDWARDFEAARAAAEKAAAGVEKARLQVSRADAAFRAAGGSAGGYAANMKQVGAEIDRVQAKQAKLNEYLKAKNEMGEWAGSARTSFIGAGIAVAAATRAFVTPAMEFESAMLGVAKQVDGARDSNGQLTQVYYDMRREIQMLGREMPMATNEIADMVTAGARMGIAKDELIGFTKTAGMMAEAFEMPAGALADSMGKIAQLYKIPIPAIGNLADSINYLDDNAISKGGDIIDFLTRTGGVASAVKVTGQEMAALGSTLLTLGERTETAGTATNAIFQKLAAAESGTKKFKAALSSVGLNAKQVQQGMQRDSIGTLMKVMEAVGKLPAEKQLGVMVNLVGLEHSDTLAKLANNTGEFRRQLELANGEAAKGSMAKEYAARLGTFGATWEKFKNQIGELATNIGTVALPVLTSMFVTLGGFIGPMADFAANNQEVIKTLIGMAAGFIAWKTTIAPVVGLIRNIGTVWKVVSLAMAANPVGLILMGVAVAAGAIMANWGTIGPWLSRMWESVSAAASTAWNSVVSVWNTAASFFGGIWDSVRTAFQGGIGSVVALIVNWSPMGLLYQGITAALGSLGIELPAKFTDLGKMLVSGLVGGITNMGSAVKGAISGLADNTIGWFRDKLGIRSPSRVFIGLGQMVGEGAAQGIGSMGQSVARASGALGLAASMAFQPAIAAGPMPAAAAGMAAPGSVAASAAAQAAGPSITQTFTFHITQQPGENAEALARRVADMVRRADQGARRAGLGDWA